MLVIPRRRTRVVCTMVLRRTERQERKREREVRASERASVWVGAFEPRIIAELAQESRTPSNAPKFVRLWANDVKLALLGDALWGLEIISCAARNFLNRAIAAMTIWVNFSIRSRFISRTFFLLESKRYAADLAACARYMLIFRRVETRRIYRSITILLLSADQYVNHINRGVCIVRRCVWSNGRANGLRRRDVKWWVQISILYSVRKREMVALVAAPREFLSRLSQLKKYAREIRMASICGPAAMRVFQARLHALRFKGYFCASEALWEATIPHR